MFAELKRLLRHVSVYGLSNIVSRMLSFLLLPFHTNLLQSTADYGIAVLLFASLGFANVLYAYGIDSAFLRFYLMQEKGFTKKNTFSTTYLSMVLTSVLFSSIIFLFPEFFAELCLVGAEHAGLIRWCSGILLFDTLVILPFLVLRAEERSTLFMVLKLINVSVTLGMNILFLVYLKEGLVGIFKANFIGSGITLIMMIPLIYRKFSFDFSNKVYAGLMKFGLPYIFTGLSVMIMDMIDRYLIKNILGESAAGIYGAGYKLSMAMVLMVTAFRFAWHPFFLSISEKGDAKVIYAKVLTYFVLIAGWIYLGICFFVKDVVSLGTGTWHFIPEDYWSGLPIVPVVMASYILYGIYVNFVVGIYIKKKSKYLPFITGISAATNIILNYYLIPVYGMMGAAYATVFSYGLMAVLLLIVTRRFYPVNYEYLRILHIVFVIAILFYTWTFIPGKFSILTEFGLLLLYPVLLFLTGFFNKQERDRFRNILNSYILKN
ncbi:lipopolysaccharide biosynthesis protein [candidate division KSB1 bacterium]